jgi:hypothetical protein
MFIKTLTSLLTKSILIAVLGMAFTPLVRAQGLVSSGIAGSISDESGRAISNATVTAVHVPTNSAYTAVSGPNGRFRFSGLRVGGPYTVSAVSPGSTIAAVEDVITALGEEAEVSLIADTGVVKMEKLVVAVSTNELDPNATGAGTVVNSRGILNQPSSNRSFADIIKTNPFVSMRAFPQITALGMNNRYNSITLDGARLNDQFGLASSGLSSLKNPFSLDAIENFSVTLTPYDVTQSGFAGASINVVSKSGTNELHGSAYYLYSSSKWQGRDLSGTNANLRPAKFYERTYGFTLGGPILKDRLFFFFNFEKYDNPGSGPLEAGFKPDSNALSVINAQVSALPGKPDLGTFGKGAPTLLTDEKRLLKLDWNISRDHRLTVRYSRTEGTQPFSPNFRATGLSTPVPTGVSTTGFVNGVTSFNSNFYDLGVDEKVWASQLFSNWTPDLKTEFAFSKNDTNALRTTPVIFPEIIIRNVPTDTGVSTGTAMLLGTDVSSMGNGVILNEISYSGNATYNWRDVTFKTGFDREETDFNNLFRSGSYGVFVYDYSPTLNLSNDKPVGFVRGVASANFPATDVSKLEQTGYFLQAKWEPTQRFNVTLGLRYDVLGSPIAPTYNAAFSTAFESLVPGIRNDTTIDGSSRLAPRLSFNYAIDKERNIQVRGGVGVFLGRNPWVWISNSYGNAGFGRFTVPRPSATAPTLGQYLSGSFTETDSAFKFDVADPFGKTNLSANTGTSDVNFLAPDLELPTNLRGNLAVDVRVQKLDATFSIEYIHTDVMKAMFYENLNLVAAGKGADNRTYFRRRLAGADIPLGTASPTGTTVNTYSSGFGRALRLRNVDAGSSDYVAFILNRPFKNGWAYNVAYTRGRSIEAQPAGSSTAGSNWGFNIVFNQGTVEETRSDYEIRDRVQASISKELSYFKNYKTTVTLGYEGRTGQPYSYVYSGDLNFDGNSANDAVAVPTDANDPRFNFINMSSVQQSAYFAFLKSSGLSAYAGGYAPRNSFIGPWQNRLDLHFSQEIKVTGPVRIELFADFTNFGNWLSKDLFNYVETLNATSTNSNQNRVLGNASYGADGRIIPTATIGADGTLTVPINSQFLPNNADARWRIVAGARLRF